MRVFQAGITAIVIATSFGLSGCGGGGGGDNSSPNPPSQNPLIGTYRIVSLQSPSGQKSTCPGRIIIDSFNDETCGANDTVTINANGTVTASTGTTSETYTISGNTIVVNNPASGNLPAYTDTLSYTISGPQLTLTQTASTQGGAYGSANYNGTVTVLQKQ